MSEIVERLRKGEACKENGGVCALMDARSGCLCATAADEIARIAALEARVKELEEGLLPFVCDCSSNCEWERDEICPDWNARVLLTPAPTSGEAT